MLLRANLNFGSYRRGDVYLMPDANYSQEQALTLLGAGYFTEVTQDGRVHHGDGVADADDPVVDPTPKSGVDDGQGEDQQGSEGPGGTEGSGTTGLEDD